MDRKCTLFLVLNSKKDINVDDNGNGVDKDGSLSDAYSFESSNLDQNINQNKQNDKNKLDKFEIVEERWLYSRIYADYVYSSTRRLLLTI